MLTDNVGRNDTSATLTRPLARHSLLIMPSLKTALFLASGAVLLPSLADASGFPERALVSAARQIARNEMATGARFGSGVPGTAAETATASDRRGLAEVQADEPWICLQMMGRFVCGSKDSEETCLAESAYSCAVGSSACELDGNKYANMGWSLDKATEPSFQKLNDTAISVCKTYASSNTSCNAQSDCIYNDDNPEPSCDVSNFFVASLLDEYCPTLTQGLTGEEYVEKFDLCPLFATTSAKCSLLTTSAACNADSDCTYTLDATDPESSKYPCVPADSNPSEVTDMLSYHFSDILYAGAFCEKTYDSEKSACDADERCEWDDSDDTCGISGDAVASILRGHPHYVRSYAISQTCETIETETLCGVADTADKCEWLEASSGDEAGCFATFTYAAQQMSCECDAVKTAAPSVDYSNLVCATPNVEFVDVYSGARTFEGGALLGGALTLAACVLALA